jgi:hypothetical protein
MKIIIFFLLFSVNFFAQSTLVLSGPDSSPVGKINTLILFKYGIEEQSGLQFDINLSNILDVKLDKSIIDKELRCNETKTRCMIIGANTTIIKNGIIAKFLIYMLPQDTDFPLTNLIATTPLGYNSPIISGLLYTLILEKTYSGI